MFQARSPSKTVAARVIGNGTGANSKVVFVDRGSTSGVESGMAVVTPDGIVGKVVDAYPTASLVMLITDPTFAAGVVSQKNRVHGTLKGQGHSECLVDYVQNEEHVDIGEWFYTSGDDRIFPKGFPVGQVTAAPNGKTFKEIYVSPSGMQGGVEEVLIVLQGVHQEVPGGEIASPAYTILPAPAQASAQTSGGCSAGRALWLPTRIVCGPSIRMSAWSRSIPSARALRGQNRPISPKFLPSMVHLRRMPLRHRLPPKPGPWPVHPNPPPPRPAQQNPAQQNPARPRPSHQTPRRPLSQSRNL